MFQLVKAALKAGLLVSALAFAGSSWAGQSAEPPGGPIDLPGKPIPPDYSKLSEHNIEWLKTQDAQVQMEFLLGAAINHDHGATDMISKLVEGWHGKLHRSQRWQDLETTALY